MKNKFMNFEDSRKFVRQLGLKTQKEWYEYCKSGTRPKDIPASPDKVYKNKGWKDTGDWLGTGTKAIRRRRYRSFKEAKKLAQSLNLRNSRQWREYCNSDKSPNDIPIHAHQIYKNDGWISYGDFLGTGTVAVKKKKFRTFEESKKFVHKLNLQSSKQWVEFGKLGKRPKDIPGIPRKIYKKDWTTWGDFLGTGRISQDQRTFRSFEDARSYARNLNLENSDQWRLFCKSHQKPDDIPTTPHKVYEKEWKGMGDWLDTGTVAFQKRVYTSFENSKKFARKLGLKTSLEWIEYSKTKNKPEEIPGRPERAYKDK